MSPAARHVPHPRRTRRALARAALLGALSLAACDSVDESAGGPDAAVEGKGLVFVVDPDRTLPEGAAPLRPDGTQEPRPYFHDFGAVPDGTEVRYTYRLQNADPAPISILSVKPSCGCTVPSLRYTAPDGEVVEGRARTTGDQPLIVVPPDAVLEVDVAIETGAVKIKNTAKLVSVTIQTDSPNGYYRVLEARVLVEVPFNVVPSSIDLGRIPQSAGGQGTCDIVPAPGFGHRITELLSVPNDVVAELDYEDVLGNDRWRVTARFEPPLDPGLLDRRILVGTETADGEPGDPLELVLTALVVDDLVTDPARFVFRAGPDASFSVRLRSLLDGHRLAVRAAHVDPAHTDWLALDFEPEDLGPDGKSPSWLLTLRTTGGAVLEEAVRGTARVRLDDPQHPEVLVEYVIHPPRTGG